RHSANAIRSWVKLLKQRTGVEDRSQGTATYSSVAPISMPAVLELWNGTTDGLDDDFFLALGDMDTLLDAKYNGASVDGPGRAKDKEYSLNRDSKTKTLSRFTIVLTTGLGTTLLNELDNTSIIDESVLACLHRHCR